MAFPLGPHSWPHWLGLKRKLDLVLGGPFLAMTQKEISAWEGPTQPPVSLENSLTPLELDTHSTPLPPTSQLPA